MTNVPTTQSTQTEDQKTGRSLLFGFIIWFLHLNILYSLTSLSCNWQWFSFSVAGMPGLRFVQIIITLIAAGLVSMTIYFPWRNWQQYQTERDHLVQNTEKDRRPLIAFITLLLNAMFLLFVLATLLPILSLSACG